MRDTDPTETERALIEARCAQGILAAQYARAQRLARSEDPHERAAAAVEANRLRDVGVALRRRIDVLQAAAKAHQQAPGHRGPPRGKPGVHIANLRAA